MSRYPYKVDYNDHFETPLRAYEDVLPLLDLVSPVPKDAVGKAKQENNRKRKRPSSSDGTTDNSTNNPLRTEHALYDPYYCAGRTKSLLQSIGFTNVVHEKRDFYADVKNGAVPDHDTFITNPPYSQDHKERCIEYAVNNLRERGKPFFLLMPNYVALKEYFRDGTALAGGREADDIVYVVPSAPYEYDHPEGTGHEIPPFASLWFCGVGRDVVQQCRRAYDNTRSSGGPRPACSLKELQALGAVKGGNRKNPKQRRKLKKMLAAATGAAATTAAGGQDIDAVPVDGGDGDGTMPRKKQNTNKGAGDGGNRDQKPPKKKKRKSKHRDSSGNRTKKRF